MMRKCLPLRAGFLSQFLRFAIVGSVVFALNALLIAVLAPLPGIGPLWAQLISFPVAVTCAWYLNRRYTFRSSRQSIRQEWGKYVLANILGWLVTNGVYTSLVLSTNFAYHHPTVAIAAGGVSGMLFNFFASRALVFRGN